eukprot:1161843-Pelagomonas_calceolata.AAC.13
MRVTTFLQDTWVSMLTQTQKTHRRPALWNSGQTVTSEGLQKADLNFDAQANLLFDVHSHIQIQY